MNPPDTTPQRKPSRLRVRIVVRAPGVRASSSATSSSTDAGSPRKVATRRRSDSAKSSSPRIAASVTALTSASAPDRAASISITSPCTRVESTSNTISRLLRRASPARSTATSTPAVRATSTSRLRSVPGGYSSEPWPGTGDTISSRPVTG